MGLIGGIWLVILGILGASNLIIARKPDAKELIGKMAPYQGWIGAVSALWGAWGIVSSILSLGMLSRAPIYWVTFLAVGAVQLVLGFLLGIGVLKTFIKTPTANAKMDQTMAKLSPYQGTLGLIGIGLGGWLIVAGFLWTVG